MSSAAPESPASLDLHEVLSFDEEDIVPSPTNTEELFESKPNCDFQLESSQPKPAAIEVEEEITEHLSAQEATELSPSLEGCNDIVEEEIVDELQSSVGDEEIADEACCDDDDSMEDSLTTNIGSPGLYRVSVPPFPEQEEQETSLDLDSPPAVEQEELSFQLACFDDGASDAEDDSIEEAENSPSSTKACAFLAEEDSLPSTSSTEQIDETKCPRLILDCTPLPSVDEGDALETPDSMPSSVKELFVGGWEGLSSDSTRGSYENENPFSNENSIWRRNDENNDDANDDDSFSNLRIMFTPSEDMGDEYSTSAPVKAVIIEDVSRSKTTRYGDAPNESPNVWRLLTYMLIFVVMTGQPNRMLQKLQLQAQSRLSKNIKQETKRPRSIFGRPTGFLDARQNMVGAWLK